jgi:TolB-like protein/Tfp pilus assembly protein PilF
VSRAATQRPAAAKIAAALAGLAVLAGGAFLVLRDVTEAPSAEEAAARPGRVTPAETNSTRSSVAVLPFVSLSADPEQEYFSDGISEELLNVLANVPGLRVPSRTSSFAFKGTNTDLRTIAAALNCEHVLEGSVRRAGNQVRITATLIEVATDSHLWSQNYVRELTDVFAIQDEIAASVAEALQIRLLGSSGNGSAGARTASADAHDAFLLGLHYLATQRSEDIFKSRDAFQRAIELDPDYAAAHAMLAASLFSAQVYGLLAPEEVQTVADPAAARALALDPKSSEAHLARGQMLLGRGDYEGADAVLRRALELRPSFAVAHGLRAFALGALNRPAEARAELAAALEHDPLNGLLTWQMGNVRLAQGRLGEAATYFRRAAEIEPMLPNAYAGLGDVGIMTGRIDEGLLQYLAGLEKDPGQPHMNAAVALLYLSLGDVERAQRWYDRAAELQQAGSLPLLFRDFTRLVVRREDPGALLAVLRDVPRLQLAPLSPRLFRKAALATRDRAGIEALFRQFWPELFATEPLVNVDNFGAATDVAWLLQGAGETERAERLIAAALAILRDPEQRSMQPLDWAYVLVETEALALQGLRTEALAALRRAIDEGWRLDWWQVQIDPTLDSIMGPEFTAMIEEVEADLEPQLARVRELERDGTIPDPTLALPQGAQQR